MAFSLKDPFKVFFCLCCFRQNHVNYEFSVYTPQQVFLNPFPYKMKIESEGLFQKQEAHLMLMRKSRQITTEKTPFSVIGKDKHEGFCTTQCYFWEHIHLIWNHSDDSPKTRNSLITRIFMRRFLDDYETLLYECFYRSLLHLISKAIIRLQ